MRSFYDFSLSLMRHTSAAIEQWATKLSEEGKQKIRSCAIERGGGGVQVGAWPLSVCRAQIRRKPLQPLSWIMTESWQARLKVAYDIVRANIVHVWKPFWCLHVCLVILSPSQDTLNRRLTEDSATLYTQDVPKYPKTSTKRTQTQLERKGTSICHCNLH